MSRKTSVLLAAAFAAPLLTASAFGYELGLINADFDGSVNGAGGVLGSTLGVVPDGDDVNMRNNDSEYPIEGWRTWGGANQMIHIWNPNTTDRWTTANNNWYDTSWGGNDASGDADGSVLVVRTQGWDYRTGSGINSGTDLSTVWHDDWGNRIWTQSADSGGSETTEWRLDSGGTADAGTGGYFDTDLDPMTPDVYVQATYTGEGGVGGWNGTATRDFEAATQGTGETFDATARYMVQVQVGRLALNGLNAGATILPGTDGVWGTADDGAGTSSRFWTDIGAAGTAQEGNFAEALWGGYMVDLMAGGETGANGNYAGWQYGSTAIVSDNNSLAVAADSWVTSTIEYIPGVSGDFSALDGQELVIRLGALELVGAHQNTTQAAFDDLVLIKYDAGDANLDNEVGLGDLSTLASNYETGPGKDWSTADFNGDGEVTLADLSLLATNYGKINGEVPAPAAAVPEPTSLALLGLGGLLLSRRRR